MLFWGIKSFNFDTKQSGSNRRIQLNELHELGNEAYENAKTCKTKTKAFHDKMIFHISFEPNQKFCLLILSLNCFLAI